MKLLDLFCGGGLAGAGYWQSGCFSEICGVDSNPAMKRAYPFDFVCGNALSLTYDFLLQFDFVHASPPCQFYSSMTPPWARDRHPRLIPPTHLMLKAAGMPYVIENVPGSGHDLRPNLIMSGVEVGVPMKRPRYFHIAHEKMIVDRDSQISGAGNSQVSHVEIAHQISGAGISHISGSQNTQIKTSVDDHNYEPSGCHSSNLNINPGANLNDRQIFNVHGDEYLSRDELIEAFGLINLPVAHLRRLTVEHIEQGIPPAMTKHIALKLFSKLMIA